MKRFLYGVFLVPLAMITFAISGTIDLQRAGAVDQKAIQIPQEMPLGNMIAQAPKDVKDVPVAAPKKLYHTGYKPMTPQKFAAFHQNAIRRHGKWAEKLPTTDLTSFDCRVTFKNVLPTDDQGQCGDCFGVSSADGATMALVLAGYGPADGSFRLSSQFGLDSSAFDGGCDGGDEMQVLDYIKSHGFPSEKEYGPYTASPGRLKDTTGMKIYKITDYGLCDPNAGQGGVASTQLMKNCMVKYGPLSIAFDAGECNNYTWPQTMTGRGRGVDHAVLCIGFDDNHDNGDGSKGAWLGMNQWGQWGGPNCTFWIKYGADSFGTEAMWIYAAPIAPPPAPVPPAPVPVPPVPPTPDPTPVPLPVPGVPVTITTTTVLPGGGTYQTTGVYTPGPLPEIAVSKTGSNTYTLSLVPAGSGTMTNLPTVPVAPAAPVQATETWYSSKDEFGRTVWRTKDGTIKQVEDSATGNCANGQCAPSTGRRRLFGW